MHFIFSNFIDDNITVRIYNISLIGTCKSLGNQQKTGIDEVPVALETVKLESGNVDLILKTKSGQSEFTVERGKSRSFYFDFVPPKYDCKIELKINYTDPSTGDAASFIQNLDLE